MTLKITEGIFASVNINANMVAMLGAIIPDPLAIAAIFIFLLPISHSS